MSLLSPSFFFWVLWVHQSLLSPSESFESIWVLWVHLNLLSPSELSETFTTLRDSAAVHNMALIAAEPTNQTTPHEAHVGNYFFLFFFFIFIYFLWLGAPSRRDELFASRENCGKSIFHFLLGPGLHLCRSHRWDSSRSSKAFKKRAASRPSRLINLDRMTSGSSPLKASAGRENAHASVPGFLTRLATRRRKAVSVGESSGWATVSRKKKNKLERLLRRSVRSGFWQGWHGGAEETNQEETWLVQALLTRLRPAEELFFFFFFCFLVKVLQTRRQPLKINFGFERVGWAAARNSVKLKQSNKHKLHFF